MNVKGTRNVVKYKVYDKNGDLKRIIDEKMEKEFITNEDWLKGVSCFVINEKNEVLIEKRSKKGLNPGKLDLCSGHRDNHETLTQAMIRELKEELGIEFNEAINVKKIKEKAAPLNLGSEEKNRNFFIDFFYLKRNNSKVSIQKKEVDYIFWVPMEKCFELIRTGKTKFPKNYNYEEIFQSIKENCFGKNENEVDISLD